MMKTFITTILLLTSTMTFAEIDVHQSIHRLPPGSHLTTKKDITIQPSEDMPTYNILEHADKSLSGPYGSLLIGRVICGPLTDSQPQERVVKTGAQYTVESVNLIHSEPVHKHLTDGVTLPRATASWRIKFAGKNTINSILLTKESSAILTPTKGSPFYADCKANYYGHYCQDWITYRSMSFFEEQYAAEKITEPTIEDLRRCIAPFAELKFPAAIELEK